MSLRVATLPRTILVVICEDIFTACLYNADLRSHSPVYEYPLNGQWIMMDIDDGYILWTGIWKGALDEVSMGVQGTDRCYHFGQLWAIPKVRAR